MTPPPSNRVFRGGMPRRSRVVAAIAMLASMAACSLVTDLGGLSSGSGGDGSVETRDAGPVLVDAPSGMASDGGDAARPSDAMAADALASSRYASAVIADAPVLTSPLPACSGADFAHAR